MGDRANIKVCGAGNVYLYTHWAGTELPGTLQAALERGKARWDDAQYLARVIFCEMVHGDEGELTGYGISGECCDGQDRILTVNVNKQTVSWPCGESISFGEYVNLTNPDWRG